MMFVLLRNRSKTIILCMVFMITLATSSRRRSKYKGQRNGRSKGSKTPDRNHQAEEHRGWCLGCLERPLEKLKDVITSISGFAGTKEEAPARKKQSRRQQYRPSFDDDVEYNPFPSGSSELEDKHDQYDQDNITSTTNVKKNKKKAARRREKRREERRNTAARAEHERMLAEQEVKNQVLAQSVADTAHGIYHSEEEPEAWDPQRTTFHPQYVPPTHVRDLPPGLATANYDQDRRSHIRSCTTCKSTLGWTNELHGCGLCVCNNVIYPCRMQHEQVCGYSAAGKQVGCRQHFSGNQKNRIVMKGTEEQCLRRKKEAVFWVCHKCMVTRPGDNANSVCGIFDGKKTCTQTRANALMSGTEAECNDYFKNLRGNVGGPTDL